MAKPAPFPFKKGKPASDKSVPPKKGTKDTAGYDAAMSKCMKGGKSRAACQKICSGM